MRKALIIAAIAVSGASYAGPAVVSWTGGTQFASFFASAQATPDMVGYQFSVTSACLVTRLGVWGDTTGGLQSAHRVSLWRVSDGLLMGSANVAPTATANTFDWTAVTPIALATGTTYVVAADYWTGGLDSYVSNPTAPIYDPLMTHIGAAAPAVVNMGYVMPTAIAPANRGRFGPNMDLQAVPEPATMAALGLGAAALIRRRRK